jgi:predicted GNAT family N-acyltransferase
VCVQATHRQWVPARPLARAVRSPAMRVGEMPPLSLRDWVALTGRDRAPFGAETADLVWRPKERHLGLWDPSGRLVAAGGLVVTTVTVAELTFEVVGVGGLIVAPDWRRRGVMPLVADPLARMAEALGPALAMIFCRDALVDLYLSRGYHRIADPVWVDQPAGRVAMPVPAMWRPLHPGATWPAGRVEVHGEPF